MKIKYISYQDTVVRVSNDTLEVTSDVDTLKKIENTTFLLESNDTTNRIETTNLQKPAAENIKRQPEKKQNKIERKEVAPDKEIVEYKNESNNAQIPINFLKTINEDQSKVKPEEVFKTQAQQQHFLKSKKTEREQILVTSDWILPVVMISLGIMIWVRNAYFRQVELLFGSINNYQMSLKLFKDPSSRFRHLSIILNLNAALTVGLFLHQLLKYNNIDLVNGNPVINFLFIELFLLVIYVLQFVGYSILGNILKSKKEYYEFLHHTYTLIKVLGIIFIPFAIIITYATDAVLPYFLILGTIIIVFFYFKRIQRGIKIIMQKQFLKLHQILYFCTLEILPIMVIFKYVNSLIERSF